MRLLCLSDLHNRFEAFAPDTLPQADLCLVAGDLTNYGMKGEKTRHEVTRAGDWLRALSARQPVVWVPGNHDFGMDATTFGVSPQLWGLSPHTLFQLRDYPFTLIGQSLCTAFDKPELARQWAYTTADPDEDAKVWAEAMKADIVLSHCPPFGVQDGAGRLYDRETGKFGNTLCIGSPGLRDYIERHTPRLVVCGHVHESAGETLYGTTRVINTAQRATLVELEEK